MARSPLKRLLLLLMVMVVCACAGLAHGVGTSRTKRIDWDALERAWEEGDAREELQSAGDEQFAALADKSEDEAKALGPQMVFVALDAARTRESLADLAARWKESLWNGGIDATVYEIAEGEKLLVALQRGVQVADLRRFLLEQPEVRELEWNGETFRPGSPASSSSQRLAPKTKSSKTKPSKTKLPKMKLSKSKSSKTTATSKTTRAKKSDGRKERVDDAAAAAAGARKPKQEL